MQSQVHSPPSGLELPEGQKLVRAREIASRMAALREGIFCRASFMSPV